MNPYVKLGLKSFSVFVGGLAVTNILTRATGQISLIDWLAVLWPAIYGLATYWGGIADSTPAPWSQAQALVTAKDAVQTVTDAQAVADILITPPSRKDRP